MHISLKDEEKIVMSRPMSEAIDLLFRTLREEARWPLPQCTFEDLTFTYHPSEVQFLRNEQAHISRIHQLRPIPGCGKTVFVIEQTGVELNRFAIRRIAMHFSTRPTLRTPRPFFEVSEMVFFVVTPSQEFGIAHFIGQTALSASMAATETEVPSKLSNSIQQVAWGDFVHEGWNLGIGNYIRYQRKRKRGQCSRFYVERSCPELLDLYDRFYDREGIIQVEEDMLFDHARNGDAEALSTLVQLSLKQVFDVAFRVCKQFSDYHPSFEDTFFGGLNGLMQAIDKYECERGHRFASFAWSWIGSKAEKAMVDSIWPIKVPYYVWETTGRTFRNFSQTKAVIEYPSTYSDRLIRPDSKSQHYRICQLMARDCLVLDTVDSFDCVADGSQLAEVEEFVDLQCIPDILCDLKPRQQEILLLRNGLHPSAPNQEMTLEQVAQYFGITRERVRQIEMMSRKLLRQWHGVTLATSTDGSEVLDSDLSDSEQITDFSNA